MKNKRKNKNNNRISKRTGMPRRDIQSFNLYKSPRVGLPQEYRTTLKYNTYLVVTNIAGGTASVRYTTNAYDVDPMFASTAMPYFTELAAIYSRFRTLRLGYKFVVQNQEAFPITIIHGFAVTSISSALLYVGYAGNPLFKQSALGPATGMGVGTYTGSRTVCEIVGSQQPLWDDLYTGSTTASTMPTASYVYCYCGLNSVNALTALGMVVSVEISLDVLFYKPNLLAV